MHRRSLAIALGTTLLALPATAQRWRPRADEIQNRVGVFFVDTDGPASDGDKVADLATCAFAHDAAGGDQLAVLYLFDGSGDQTERERFERALFGDDELGIALRCFRCGRIDIAKQPALLARFGKRAPLFVAIDKDGKATDEVSMAGTKPDDGAQMQKAQLQKALMQKLEKAATGAIKPPLATFTKDYGKLVADLEQVLRDKQDAEAKLAKAGTDKPKRAAAEKDQKEAAAAEQKLLDKERELLGKVKLPERPASAQRLGNARPARGGKQAGGASGANGAGGSANGGG